MSNVNDTTQASNQSITTTWTNTTTSIPWQLPTSTVAAIVVPVVVGVILIALVVIRIVIYKMRGFCNRPNPINLPAPEGQPRTLSIPKSSKKLRIRRDRITNVDDVSHIQIKPIVFLANANDTLRPAHKDHEVRTIDSIYQNFDNSTPSSATTYYNVQVPVPSHVGTEAATGNSKIPDYVNVTLSADGPPKAHGATRSRVRPHDYVNLNNEMPNSSVAGNPNTWSSLPVSAQDAGHQNIYNSACDLEDWWAPHST